MLNPSLAKQMGLAIAVVFELTLAVCIGGGAGYWLDSSLGTSPGFTFSLSILALLVFFRRLTSTLRQAAESDDDELQDPRP